MVPPYDGLIGASREDLVARAEMKLEVTRRLARRDSARFVEFVMRDEERGLPIKNAPIHERMHQHVSANAKSITVAPVEHGKSSSLATPLPLFYLGNNPNLRGAIISATAKQARKTLAAVRAYIERSVELKELFPHLRPSTQHEATWGQDAITVERDLISRDPSIQVCGIEAVGSIVGSRLDWIILDDILTFENTRTKEQCEKIIESLDTSVFTRLTANAKLIFVGTPWTEEDAISVLSRRRGFKTIRLSAVKNPDDPPSHWVPTWPERWPVARLIEKYETTPAFTFARKYLCRVFSRLTSRWSEEWISIAKRLGMGRAMSPRRPVTVPTGKLLRCFTGVDLGTSKRKKARSSTGADLGDGLSVLFTIAIDDRGRRVVLNIRSGRWKGPELLVELADVHARYESEILVEDNGVQDFILDFASERSIPVMPFTTGKNKHDETYGIESIGVEMRRGLWVVPSGADGRTIDPEVDAWFGEMRAFSPHGHTGDRLMASWFAREGARAGLGELAIHMPTIHR